MQSMTIRLKELVQGRELLVAPGVFDCVSAKVAADAGFEAIYVGSYATTAAMFGLPDTGFIGLTDMVSQLWRVSAVVNVPIIVDAEAGFGNPVHVTRAVQELERAGAAAVHIEDHVFGKHVVNRPAVVPLSDAVDKIRAALDARRDSNFQIIARTDSLRGYGLSHAIERAHAFASAGADMVFIAGLRSGDIAAVVRDLPIPLLQTNRSSLDPPELKLSNAQLAAVGLKVVIYNDLASLLAYAAVRAGLDELRRSGSVDSLSLTIDTPEFDTFLGVSGVRAVIARYGMGEGGPILS